MKAEVEDMDGGSEPIPDVECYLEPVLVHLADALTGVCAGLTVNDRLWFFNQVNQLWLEALRSSDDAAGEGVFSRALDSGN